MSDHTNPPAGGHHPGAAGGPQGPYGGPPQGQPQHNPYAGPQGQPGQQGPYSGPQGPGAYPGQGQPQYGPQGGQPQGGQPQGGQPQPGQYAPQQGPQYGGPAQPGAPLWPQPGQPDYPQQGNYPGDGGQPPYGGFPPAQQWQPEPKKKRGKLIPLVAILGVLAVVAGGSIFAYARLNGGDQPAAVLPGNSIAYARIDLNPSAGQKVAALRFLMKFPSAKEKIGLTSDNDDLRQKLFELIKKDAGEDLADVDFDKDIKPWLGDRAGVAAIPGTDGDEPNAVVAVEVKNEDKATAGLDKLFANEKEKPGRAFSNGYVILSEDQPTVDAAVASSKSSPLSENARFNDDMKALGEQGFVSLWADFKAIAAAAGSKLPEAQRTAIPDGSVAAALRFDSQYVELKGIVRGDKSLMASTATAGDVVSKLPDTTAGALAVSGGENLIDKVWAELQKTGGAELNEMVKGFTTEFGLTLPDDLKPLLGKNFALAIDKDSADIPKIAARIETDPAKAEAVVDKVTELIRTRTPVDIPIEKAKDEDTLVIATDQAYAEQVLKGGNLGATESFKQAVPDTSGAIAVGYVDFASLASLDEELSSDKDFAALRSAGFSSRIVGDGVGEFSLRVTAK